MFEFSSMKYAQRHNGSCDSLNSPYRKIPMYVHVILVKDVITLKKTKKKVCINVQNFYDHNRNRNFRIFNKLRIYV